MTDTFVTRLRAAAAAAWWTALIWAVLMTASWLAALGMMHARPQWALCMIGGGGVTWDEIQKLYLWFFSGFKVALWLWVMAAIFLSLWGRRLRRAAGPQV